MRILVTNDDGIEARGIHHLVIGLQQWIEASPGNHSLVVVAPKTNCTGAGASVGDVFHRDQVSYTRYQIPGAEKVEAFGADATPALCTFLGALGAFGDRPDLVISGINIGVNVGRSVLHSGTVGAVLTAAQLGISGMAVSIQAVKRAPYETAATVATALLDDLAAAPVRTVFNVNVPGVQLGQLKGIRQGRISNAGIIKSTKPPTNAHTALKLGEEGFAKLELGTSIPELGDVSDERPDDDGALIAAGFASVSAIRTISEVVDPEIDLFLQRGIASACSKFDFPDR
jgi:5'-nucleotidase